MNRAIVFWPADVKSGNGFCFGWTEPIVCVAGVLDDDTEELAQQSLKQACSIPTWQTYARLCRYTPRILGKYTFDGSLGPSLQRFDKQGSEITLVKYQRHGANSLRYHILRPPQSEVLRVRPEHVSAQNEKLAESFDQDFTRIGKWTGLGDVTIHQLNSAKPLQDFINGHTGKPSGLWIVFDYFLSLICPPMFSALHLLRSFCRLSLFPFETRTKDVFAFAQQIDIRTDQVSSLLSEIPALRNRGSSSVNEYAARYTGFFNTLWLILNDITIGYALGSFLIENNVVLSSILSQTIDDVLIEQPQAALRWLDSWPAGLKLNTELSKVYATSFTELIQIWSDILHALVPLLPVFLYVVGLFTTLPVPLPCSGSSLALSIFKDLLSFLTLHFSLAYYVSHVAYETMLRYAGGLWMLFRGKRYNVLRQRTDSHLYDMDQLLFGTILFTLLAFLFPTVLVYYALFAMIRLALLLCHAALEMQITFMNNFPLFAIMLRIKDGWRLPGGVYFVYQHSKAGGSLVLKNQPITLSHIFSQYIHLFGRLAAHYNPLRLLYRVLAGKRLDPISRGEMGE